MKSVSFNIWRMYLISFSSVTEMYIPISNVSKRVVFVYQQDYGQITGLIYMKLGGRVKHGPRKNLLHFGAAPQIIFQFH